MMYRVALAVALAGCFPGKANCNEVIDTSLRSLLEAVMFRDSGRRVSWEIERKVVYSGSAGYRIDPEKGHVGEAVDIVTRIDAVIASPLKWKIEHDSNSAGSPVDGGNRVRFSKLSAGAGLVATFEIPSSQEWYVEISDSVLGEFQMVFDWEPASWLFENLALVDFGEGIRLEGREVILSLISGAVIGSAKLVLDAGGRYIESLEIHFDEGYWTTWECTDAEIKKVSGKGKYVHDELIARKVVDEPLESVEERFFDYKFSGDPREVASVLLGEDRIGLDTHTISGRWLSSLSFDEYAGEEN